jgi:outer membrane receptor protein involved in Fe transport
MRRLGHGFLIPSSLLILCCRSCARLPTRRTRFRPIERVVVTATRLDDQSAPKDDVPASITILDRERIARAVPATSGPPLGEAGITCSSIKSATMSENPSTCAASRGQRNRCFCGRRALSTTRETTRFALEQFPLEAIERVEITRGPAAALAGAAAEAGVVRSSRATAPNPVRRCPLPGDVGHATSRRVVWGTFGGFDLFLAGFLRHDGRLSHERRRRPDPVSTPVWAYALGAERRLSLTVLSSDLSYGNPVL